MPINLHNFIITSHKGFSSMKSTLRPEWSHQPRTTQHILSHRLNRSAQELGQDSQRTSFLFLWPKEMQKIVFQEQGNEDVACIPQQNINQQKTGNASIPVFIPFSQVKVIAHCWGLLYTWLDQIETGNYLVTSYNYHCHHLPIFYLV